MRDHGDGDAERRSEGNVVDGPEQQIKERWVMGLLWQAAYQPILFCHLSNMFACDDTEGILHQIFVPHFLIRGEPICRSAAHRLR